MYEGMCIPGRSTCEGRRSGVKRYDSPIVYAVKHRSEETRAASRSGGIFTALSDQVLKMEGVVYGCALNESFEAVHIRAVTTAERDRMRGSKYTQSTLGDTFRQAKQDLDDGRYVLFSGTSCQIAGLLSFLGKEYERLLTVDIVCHGVPSPKVWRDYLKWNEEKQGSKISAVDFRNKADYGWASHVETLYFENGKRVDSKTYTNLFYSHLILRPSCYHCPYKSIMHPGDITIADYWGIDTACPGFNDNKGVSLVLINDDKGKDTFASVVSDILYEKCRIEDSMQTPLKAPFDPPVGREQYWRDYGKNDFTLIVRKYGNITLLRRAIRKMKRGLKKIFH